MQENNLTQDLLDFNKKSNKDEYSRIIKKITNGDYILLLPSINKENNSNDWKTIKKGDSLTLKSVFNLDGLKVLAVFSAVETMTKWSNEQVAYTGMKSNDLIDFCQNHNIDRIVIDPNQPSTFILERSSENIKPEEIKEDTKVLVAPLKKSIEGELLNRFIKNFKSVNTIIETYQYLMVRNNENILVIGFNLSNYNDNSRKACFHAVQNTMNNVQLDLPLEIFFLENKNWYKTVKGIPNALMYKK